MTTITLPKTPLVPLFMDHDCRQELDAMFRTRDLEVAKAVLEGAAKVLTHHQIPVGNSAAGEMACDWTYAALRECCENILALKVKHHE
jgi:hypothetical protein